MDNIVALTSILDAITTFLDFEETQGFLSQDEVDNIIFVENMLSEKIIHLSDKHTTTSHSTLVPQLDYSLLPTYLYDDDNDDGGINLFYPRKNNEFNF